jgi:hypothetical protein
MQAPCEAPLLLARAMLHVQRLCGTPGRAAAEVLLAELLQQTSPHTLHQPVCQPAQHLRSSNKSSLYVCLVDQQRLQCFLTSYSSLPDHTCPHPPWLPGHGMQVEDEDGDEADGLDEAIFPADVQREGCLVDDVMHELLVRPLKEGEQEGPLKWPGHQGSAFRL